MKKLRITIDEYVDDEIKEFLLTQDGITSVELIVDENTSIEINYKDKTTPNIIKKYIDLYIGKNYSNIIEFDKNTNYNCKKINYKIEDMCCEYCYRGLVDDLFDNEFIKSVKSNYKYNLPKYNIEFIIEYSDAYNEEKLINYIKEKYEH